MLAVFYVIFCLICLFLARFIYKFLINFYKKPFLVNSYAEFIPSSNIFKKQFIKNKSGNYSAVLKLEGYSYFKENNLEEAILKNYKLKCRALNFNNLKENMQLKFIFKRYKLLNSNNFTTNYYIEITGELKSVEDTLQSLQSSLASFNAKVLENNELLEYLFENCNLVKKELKNANIAINDLCAYSSISFENDYGMIKNLDIEKYFKVFSFNFGSEINNEFFKQLITANLEFDFIINTKFFTRFATASSLSADKKNISSSKAKDGSLNISSKKISEIQSATEILMNEDANLALYDAFIIVYADKHEIENIGNQLKAIVNNYDVYLIEETYLLNFFFLQKLCGFALHNSFKFLSEHLDILVYAKKVLSITLSGIFDYVNTPTGLLECDWGKGSIAKLNTHYNNLYNFNLHVSNGSGAVAHGVIIAPTGGGKTTFMQYIISGILANFKEIDIYTFDRFSGIEIFTEYKNGKNIDFNNVSLNPLLLDLSITENKTFLNTFLTMLSRAKSNADIAMINDFVDTIALLDYKVRILKVLIEEYIPPSELKDNIKQWIDGKYSPYLAGAKDSINLDDDRFFTFQMDKILDDEELSAPIIYLMMFKIRQKAKHTGRGHFIFIDESAKMVKNPYFKSQIEVLLQEHRKLRGAVWLAFQNPNAFLSEDLLRELILNQCQNQILFSSDAINQNILDRLKIHNSFYKELEATKKSNKNEYYILLKRPSEGVILDINLKPILGDELKFYSSKTSDVLRMKELKMEHGNEWRKYF